MTKREMIKQIDELNKKINELELFKQETMNILWKNGYIKLTFANTETGITKTITYQEYEKEILKIK